MFLARYTKIQTQYINDSQRIDTKCKHTEQNRNMHYFLHNIYTCILQKSLLPSVFYPSCLISRPLPIPPLPSLLGWAWPDGCGPSDNDGLIYEKMCGNVDIIFWPSVHIIMQIDIKIGVQLLYCYHRHHISCLCSTNKKMHFTICIFCFRRRVISFIRYSDSLAFLIIVLVHAFDIRGFRRIFGYCSSLCKWIYIADKYLT